MALRIGDQRWMIGAAEGTQCPPHSVVGTQVLLPVDVTYPRLVAGHDGNSVDQAMNVYSLKIELGILLLLQIFAHKGDPVDTLHARWNSHQRRRLVREIDGR